MRTTTLRTGHFALLVTTAALAACAASNPPPPVDEGPAPPAPTEQQPGNPPAAASVAPAAPTTEPVATAEPTSVPAATAEPATVVSAAPTASTSFGPAGANLHVSSMTADGLTLEDLSCHADGLGLLGSMIVVGSISKKKAALNACGTGKPRVEWTASKGTVSNVKVKADNAKMEACVAKALKGTQAPFEGECAATIVLGK